MPVSTSIRCENPGDRLNDLMSERGWASVSPKTENDQDAAEAGYLWLFQKDHSFYRMVFIDDQTLIDFPAFPMFLDSLELQSSDSKDNPTEDQVIESVAGHIISYLRLEVSARWDDLYTSIVSEIYGVEDENAEFFLNAAIDQLVAANKLVAAQNNEGLYSTYFIPAVSSLD